MFNTNLFSPDTEFMDELEAPSINPGIIINHIFDFAFNFYSDDGFGMGPSTESRVPDCTFTQTPNLSTKYYSPVIEEKAKSLLNLVFGA